MNDSLQSGLCEQLKAHYALCLEAMALTTRENQALGRVSGYDSFEFYQSRKNLLPRLQESLMALRKWRTRWQQANPGERANCADAQALLSSVQSLLMKVLLLDRDNQQSLLRKGLLPPQQLPEVASQQPHCVVDAYRRHSRA